MNKILFPLILLATTFSNPASDGYNYRPYISTNMAKATMVEVIDVVEDECDGSGWIIQGDGHKTECPGCSKCINLTIDTPESEPEQCVESKCPPVQYKPQRKGLLKRIFRR